MRTKLSMVSLIILFAAGSTGCQGQLAYNLPPSSRLMHPGPGVGGPGPGVLPTGGGMGGMPGGMPGGMGGMPPGMGMGPGGYGPMCGPPGQQPPGNPPIQQCNFQCNAGSVGGFPSGACFAGAGCMTGAGTSQIAFLGEDGIQVQWDVSGHCMFDSTALIVPGRQNFAQGSIYRLKVTNVPGRPGAVLYPTLEIAPVTPRTGAYLAHAPIPIQFTEEDFDQVLSGNFVTKVIYLPDPEFQELALAGPETLVSTRLDPGVDPIAEADRRGSILAILRIGNKDLEMLAGGYSGSGVLPAEHQQAQYQRGPRTRMQPRLEPTPIDQYERDYDGDINDQFEGDLGRPVNGEVFNGQVVGGGDLPSQAPYKVSPSDGYYGDEGTSGPGGYYAGGGSYAQMPLGMPTAGFAPPVMPPHMIAGMGPQYGMPITGTPIGLPGPPHIPLGAPAGLTKHVMKNRTRMAIPQPVHKFKMSVKQRPGMNYPDPVNTMKVDEQVRQPFRLPGLRTLLRK